MWFNVNVDWILVTPAVAIVVHATSMLHCVPTCKNCTDTSWINTDDISSTSLSDSEADADDL